MKKIIALVLTMLLMVSMLTACGKTSPVTVEQGTQAPAEAVTDEGQRHKIGVVFYSIEDNLGSTVYSILNRAAEIMDVDIAWAVDMSSLDAQITNMENLISAGCDGILLIPFASSIQEQAVYTAEQYDVKLSFCFREIGSDVRDIVINSPNFVSTCYEDEYAAGVMLMETLAKQGITKIGAGYMAPGDPLYDARKLGMIEGAEKNGITILGDYTRSSLETEAELANIQNLVSAYSDIEAIVTANATGGLGTVAINYLSGLDKTIKYATFDIIDDAEAAFNSGILAACTGCTAPDALYNFILLANAVKGTPLTDEVVELNQPYIYITSAEDLAVVAQATETEEGLAKVFSEDFVKSMDKTVNPDATYEEFVSNLNSWSIDLLRDALK